MNIFGIMLITWLLYRTIKICGCHFQRCFSKLMHLNLLDTILSSKIITISILIIFIIGF